MTHSITHPRALAPPQGARTSCIVKRKRKTNTEQRKSISNWNKTSNSQTRASTHRQKWTCKTTDSGTGKKTPRDIHKRGNEEMRKRRHRVDTVVDGSNDDERAKSQSRYIRVRRDQSGCWVGIGHCRSPRHTAAGRKITTCDIHVRHSSH